MFADSQVVHFTASQPMDSYASLHLPCCCGATHVPIAQVGHQLFHFCNCAKIIPTYFSVFETATAVTSSKRRVGTQHLQKVGVFCRVCLRCCRVCLRWWVGPCLIPRVPGRSSSSHASPMAFDPAYAMPYSPAPQPFMSPYSSTAYTPSTLTLTPQPALYTSQAALAATGRPHRKIFQWHLLTPCKSQLPSPACAVCLSPPDPDLPPIPGAVSSSLKRSPPPFQPPGQSKNQ